MEELLAPIYPHLRYEGSLSQSTSQKVPSLRSSATLQLQDSGEFDTEDVFQKLNFQTEKHPYGDVRHQNGSPEVNKAGSRYLKKFKIIYLH